MGTTLFFFAVIAFIVWVYQQEVKGGKRLAKDRMCEAQGFNDYNRTLFELQDQFDFPINKYLTPEEMTESIRRYNGQPVNQEAVSRLERLIQQRR